ncbi:MAG: hypothetical protein WAR39_05740, partial [Prevotella sp.]
MKATELTFQQVERAIRKIAQKFPSKEESTIITDIRYCPIKVCKPIFLLSLYLKQKRKDKMELTQLQISEIISNYTS